MTCISCGRAIAKSSAFCRFCGAPQPDTAPMPPVTPRKRTRGNGMGCAYKRGKTWTAKVRQYTGIADETHTHPRFVTHTRGGFPTKKEALQYCASLKGIPKKDQKKTLQSYWDIYVRDSLTKLARTKQVNYKTAWRRLESLRFRDVTTLTVSDLRDVVSQTCVTFNPARDVKTVLNKLFALAAADGLVSKDLPSFIVLPEAEPKEKQPFKLDEVSRIMELWEQGNIFSGYILLMIYTSMMPGELLGLKKSMIDLDGQRIVGAGIKTKQRKEQSIVFPSFLTPIIMKLMAQSETDDMLPGYYYEKFSNAYYATLELAKCRRLTPYSCRHTTATVLALDPDVAPALISRVMRHSARMTERYTHPDDTAAIQTIDHMAKTLYNSSESKHGAD